MSLSANLLPLSFDQLAGWCDDDHLAAYNCFLISAERMCEKPYSTKTLGIAADRLAQIGNAALENPATTGEQAKQFFEKNFTPHQFIDSDYNGLLRDAFHGEAVPVVMCRHQICIDWDGRLYDCDFNIALNASVTALPSATSKPTI